MSFSKISFPIFVLTFGWVFLGMTRVVTNLLLLTEDRHSKIFFRRFRALIIPQPRVVYGSVNNNAAEISSNPTPVVTPGQPPGSPTAPHQAPVPSPANPSTVALKKDVIFFASPVCNRRGYVKFLSRAWRAYSKIPYQDLHLFDCGSTQYNSTTLVEWFKSPTNGEDFLALDRVFRHEKRIHADSNTRKAFMYFAYDQRAAKYSVIVTMDSDLLPHPIFIPFIQQNIHTTLCHGALSIYNSAAHPTGRCGFGDGLQKEVCLKKHIGAAGATMTKEVARAMLPENSKGAFDWGFVAVQGKWGRCGYCSAKKSLSMHIGVFGQNNGPGNFVEWALGTNIKELGDPWVAGGVDFYLTKKTNPDNYYGGPGGEGDGKAKGG